MAILTLCFVPIEVTDGSQKFGYFLGRKAGLTIDKILETGSFCGLLGAWGCENREPAQGGVGLPNRITSAAAASRGAAAAFGPSNINICVTRVRGTERQRCLLLTLQKPEQGLRFSNLCRDEFARK